MSDDQGTIEPNEELECFVGINFKDAIATLEDVGVEYILISKNIWHNSLGYNANRVRLFVGEDDVVQTATYG
jgi:hypothetical protein